MKAKTCSVVKSGKEVPVPMEQLQKETDNLKSYFLYLPVPAEVADALTLQCQKDQNIKLVTDPKLATLSFYCSYSEALQSVIYVVANKETTGAYRANTIHVVPYYFFPAIDQKTKKPLTVLQIADNIYNTLLMNASKSGWLNKNAKK